MISPGRASSWVSAAGWPERAGPSLGTPPPLPAPPPARVTTRPPGSGALAPNNPRQGSTRRWWHHSQRYSPLSVPAFARRLSVCPFLSITCWRGLIAVSGHSQARRSDRTRTTRESEGSEGRRTPAGDRMKFSPAHYLLPLLPALVFSTRWVQEREGPEPRGAAGRLVLLQVTCGGQGQTLQLFLSPTQVRGSLYF